MRGGSLMRFARDVYSQNGEDGVLAEVFRRLEIKQPGTFVEFGAGDGRSLSNTLRLAEAGWSGVWIEADMQSAAKAAEEAKRFDGRVEMLHGLVGTTGAAALDEFLKATRVPRNLDFMSIDIDSIDLQVWDALRHYHPKVVLIEINSSIAPGVEQVHGAPGVEGASFTSMMKVAEAKGYRLACHTGNLVFVDAELFPKLRLPMLEVASPSSIFNPMWVEWAASKGAT